MGSGDVEGVIEGADDHRLPLEQAIHIAKTDTADVITIAPR